MCPLPPSDTARYHRWQRIERLTRAPMETRIAEAGQRTRHRDQGSPFAAWKCSKWNKIEHRLFSFISQNWRAKPLVSYRVIVDLITATTTDTGLKVLCELDKNCYPKGVAVSDAEMATLNIQREDFHGEWNYTISPTKGSKEAVIS